MESEALFEALPDVSVDSLIDVEVLTDSLLEASLDSLLEIEP